MKWSHCFCKWPDPKLAPRWRQTACGGGQVVVLAQVLAADINIGYEEGLVNTQARHQRRAIRNSNCHAGRRAFGLHALAVM